MLRLKLCARLSTQYLCTSDFAHRKETVVPAASGGLQHALRPTLRPGQADGSRPCLAGAWAGAPELDTVCPRGSCGCIDLRAQTRGCRRLDIPCMTAGWWLAWSTLTATRAAWSNRSNTLGNNEKTTSGLYKRTCELGSTLTDAQLEVDFFEQLSQPVVIAAELSKLQAPDELGARRERSRQGLRSSNGAVCLLGRCLKSACIEAVFI